ncbi:DUF4190 domain-containing protein [Demequina sp. NBRC 110053]|uniref:DUF4190 domain-containing protein n=1 Tax=Demequina sp. NBRC 110053 TaxID=1570342 RepID=UPI000A01648B|nr:DUF4190 domain-containing protein [Demequina sp. NBRC 110053]
MTTQDPFQNPPSTGGWAPESAAPPTPEYQVNTYGAGDTAGYSSPPSYAYPSPAATATQSSSYPAPPYQQASSSPSGGTDGVSIAALVTGILGLGFVATILGAIGLRRTADGDRSGAGMAWAGVVLGILGTIGWSVVMGFWIATANAAFSTFEEEFSAGFEEGLEGSAYSGDGDFTASPTYGDDPALDALWDACEAGDDPACDDLYEQAEWNSGYEAFGDACGGRGRPVSQLWCEDGRGF